MLTLIQNASQVITVDSGDQLFKRGTSMNNIGVLTEHSIICEGILIKDVVPSSSVKNLSNYKVIDVNGKIVLPGLVECHTHTAFAGSRADEFKQRLQGVSYEDIARSGGGIITTVNAVRSSTFQELVSIISPRINSFITQGVTTLEIKSGYGLNFENEIKLLKVINHLESIFPITIVPTFLGAHTFPPEKKDNRHAYIKEITDEMLPYIAEHDLAQFCDAFCESTSFTAAEVEQIFSKCRELEIKVKLHTEQFNNIGGLLTALQYNAASADHLEVLLDNDIPAFSGSSTVAVLLPGVSFSLDYQYAPARKLIDNNAIVALATDYNPGTSNIPVPQIIMSLAALKMKMTIEEIISSYTINAACALKLSGDRGSIEPEKAADFAVFDTDDYADIVYNVGRNLNCMTIKDAEIIYTDQTKFN